MWWIPIAAAGPTGVLVADPALRSLSRLDHRAVVLTDAEADALAAWRERARMISWTPDCPGDRWVVLRDADRIDPIPLRTEAGAPATDAGGRPWRWDHEWRIGPPCADRDGLPALLDPAIARWSSSSGWAYRIEVPIAVSPQAVAARGLELWVVDPGRVRVELEAAGAAGPSTSSDALDAALDRRLDAATAALAPLGLVAVDWGGGSSHGGAVTSARRHRDVWFAPGTDLAGLDAAAIANRVTVDRIDRPARWVGFVVLAEPDPAAAERALRVAVPEATAIGPWGGPW